MSHSIESLNRMSLLAIRRLFTNLAAPEASSLSGLFRGIFVGPGWLRQMWGPLLAVTGLGGWWGKEFDLNGNAINLVFRSGSYQRIFPMTIGQQASHLDRKEGLALRYRPENPFPWPLIVDELRRIDSDLILGMTLADLAPFRRLAFPFILHSRETLD